MTKEEASKYPHVQAIRADKLVGRGTCSRGVFDRVQYLINRLP